MEAPNGQDLVEDLQSQLTSLRNRVEELERENKRLVSQISRCRCSKEENPAFHMKNSVSSKGNPPKANQCDELPRDETLEPAVIFSSDHSITSSSNLVKEEDIPVDGLYEENCTKCVKPKLRDGPGCHVRTIHHHVKRYVALKIMYFGQRFYGFASEAQMDPTIESEIFKALKRTMLLLGNKEDSHYSRCGRTDRGVSSTGQVISLYLRSNLKDTGVNIHNEAILKAKFEEEIDYVRVLNKVLPKDIRVIGWCPVPTDFHARFSCLSRVYRYLFWRGSMDILAMQKAAKKFIGEYDFRNFCKMDAANVSNYRRQISNFEISSCNQRFCFNFVVRCHEKLRSDDDELWAMTIRGSAFLWHQVRCMVAVLFMIGQGFESPNVLDVLLDTSKATRKPQYNMAPELPLVLQFCEFEDLQFICSSDARQALHEHLKSEFQIYMLQAAIFHEALGRLSWPVECSSELCKKKRGHIPLMLRPTEPSYEERRARLNAKSTHKSPLNCPKAVL